MLSYVYAEVLRWLWSC